MIVHIYIHMQSPPCIFVQIELNDRPFVVGLFHLIWMSAVWSELQRIKTKAIQFVNLRPNTAVAFGYYCFVLEQLQTIWLRYFVKYIKCWYITKFWYVLYIYITSIRVHVYIKNHFYKYRFHDIDSWPDESEMTRIGISVRKKDREREREIKNLFRRTCLAFFNIILIIIIDRYLSTFMVDMRIPQITMHRKALKHLRYTIHDHVYYILTI